MTTIYTVNNKVLKNSANDKWLTKKAVDPYNPLGLPAGVFRIRVTQGTSSWSGAQSAALVQGTTDVYDVQFTEANATSYNKAIVLEVLGANTTGWTTGFYRIFQGCTNLTNVALFDTSSATNMIQMFDGCAALTAVPLFDTSNVTFMNDMFYSCSALTSVPVFNTSNVTTMLNMFQSCSSLISVPLLDTSSVSNMSHMFAGCTKVESGALALYQQASSQSNPPTNHENSFKYCGVETVTGAAELAQIPSSWGGTGA